MVLQWEILAGVRFFLAWVVACSHLQHFVPGNDPLIEFRAFSGFSAVLGFLLISGFSIAHSVSKNSKGFYLRRIIRIYPLYIPPIIISIIPFLIFGSKIISLDSSEYVQPTLPNFLANIVFLQNIIFAPLPANGVVWTLGLEVTCYLLAPLLVRLSFNKIFLLIGISSSSFFLYNCWGSPLGEDIAFLRYGLPFLFLFWAWLFGFLLFLHPRKKLLGFLAILLGCFLLNVYHHDESKLFIFPYLLSVLALIYSRLISFSKSFQGLLKYLGEISYPLYLFHSFAFILGYCILPVRNGTLLMAISIFISIVLYHLIDIPIRYKSSLSLKKLRKRI